jgi:hypothetical protein
MAISASGEGCHKQMEPFLTQVMDGVMNYIQDPHPRQAYNLIQIAVFFYACVCVFCIQKKCYILVI